MQTPVNLPGPAFGMHSVDQGASGKANYVSPSLSDPLFHAHPPLQGSSAVATFLWSNSSLTGVKQVTEQTSMSFGLVQANDEVLGGDRTGLEHQTQGTMNREEEGKMSVRKNGEDQDIPTSSSESIPTQSTLLLSDSFLLNCWSLPHSTHLEYSGYFGEVTLAQGVSSRLLAQVPPAISSSPQEVHISSSYCHALKPQIMTPPKSLRSLDYKSVEPVKTSMPSSKTLEDDNRWDQPGDRRAEWILAMKKERVVGRRNDDEKLLTASPESTSATSVAQEPQFRTLPCLTPLELVEPLAGLSLAIQQASGVVRSNVLPLHRGLTSLLRPPASPTPLLPTLVTTTLSLTSIEDILVQISISFRGRRDNEVFVDRDGLERLVEGSEKVLERKEKISERKNDEENASYEPCNSNSTSTHSATGVSDKPRPPGSPGPSGGDSPVQVKPDPRPFPGTSSINSEISSTDSQAVEPRILTSPKSPRSLDYKSAEPTKTSMLSPHTRTKALRGSIKLEQVADRPEQWTRITKKEERVLGKQNNKREKRDVLASPDSPQPALESTNQPYGTSMLARSQVCARIWESSRLERLTWAIMMLARQNDEEKEHNEPTLTPQSTVRSYS